MKKNIIILFCLLMTTLAIQNLKAQEILQNTSWKVKKITCEGPRKKEDFAKAVVKAYSKGFKNRTWTFSSDASFKIEVFDDIKKELSSIEGSYAEDDNSLLLIPNTNDEEKLPEMMKNLSIEKKGNQIILVDKVDLFKFYLEKQK